MTESQDQASAAALSAMKLTQLQAIANQIGLKGISRLRKSELIEAIRAHGDGHSAAVADQASKKSTPQTTKQAKPQSKAEASKAQSGKAQSGKAPQKSAPAKSGRRGQDSSRQGQDSSRQEGTKERRSTPRNQRRGSGASADTSQRKDSSQSSTETLDVFAEFASEAKHDTSQVSSLEDIRLPSAEEEESQDTSARRRRGRDRRDRKRRPNQRESQSYEEVEVSDADVLIPIAGVLDVLDNYAFVRTTGYLPGSSDVYVNLGMVRRYSLRRGDAVTGAVRQPREGETSNRQKFNALVAPEQVNNAPVAEAEGRPEFDTLTATYPQQFVSLGGATHTQNLVDTLAPIALGQRVLVSTDSGVKRLQVLQEIAQGIATSHPNVHLMVVLIDERPEDATHLQRNIHGEVIASSFDRSGNDHTTVATLAVDRAKRLVELGQDVIVIFDSLTSLARAYYTSTNPSSRVLEHGVDASTMTSLKQVFGAGRNIENGGSLTMIATGVRGSDVGDFILRELEPAANAHIRLEDGPTAPIVVPEHTYTRNLEAVFDIEELAPRIVLRRLVAERDDSVAWLDQQLDGKTAHEFLTSSIKVTPKEKAEIRRLMA